MTKNKGFDPNPQTEYKIVSALDETMGLTVCKSVRRHCWSILTPSLGTSVQKFVFLKGSSRNSFRIFNVVNDKPICLKPIRLTNGEFLKFEPFDNSLAEQWEFEPVGTSAVTEGTRFRIKSCSGYYMDLRNQKAENDNEAIIWSSTKSATQIWRILPL